MDGDISRSRGRPSGAADTGIRRNLEPLTRTSNEQELESATTTCPNE